MSKRTNLISLSRSVSTEGVLSSDAIQMGTIVNFPTITAVSYPGNDTAVALAGGDTVTLTGTNFKTGAKVVVNGAQPSVVTIVNSTQITFTAPANAVGSYVIYVVNTDGSTALAVPGLQYSGFPSWTTAAGSLGISPKAISFSTTLTATGDAPITYSLASGTLPPGLTLNSSTGVLSGTTPTVSADTTYSFTIRSTDAQNQDTDRTFSLTVLYTNPTPTASYILVGGGGGGSNRAGGGGGGVKTGSISPTPGNQYAITIGGAGASASVGAAAPGTDTTFNSVIAGGGGYGGAGGQGYGSGGGGGSATNGGCGGGAGLTTSGASPSPASGGSGYTNGGDSAYQFNVAGVGGGGGGFSASGTSGYIQTLYNPNGSVFATIGYAGNGGNGTSASSWDLGTVSGGGGGSGGSGGGTAGSGSGSGSYGGGGNAGASGGQGAVVIRYADTYDAAYATTGSPTVTVSGGYRTYKFTSSGSITF